MHVLKWNSSTYQWPMYNYASLIFTFSLMSYYSSIPHGSHIILIILFLYNICLLFITIVYSNLHSIQYCKIQDMIIVSYIIFQSIMLLLVTYTCSIDWLITSGHAYKVPVSINVACWMTIHEVYVNSTSTHPEHHRGPILQSSDYQLELDAEIVPGQN